MPAGQLWGTSSLGGFTSIGQLSKKLRHTAQPLMKGDQFARVEPAAGKKRGDTVFFNKVSNVATAGGALSETQPIPITNITITQSSVVMTEYGNGISFTGKLEALSEFEIDSIILQPLRNDAAKRMDIRSIAELKSTQLIYEPTGSVANPSSNLDTAGSATVAATRDIQAFDVYDVVERMRGTYFVPTYDGELVAA